jgi:signal transduction histidine kinase
LRADFSAMVAHELDGPIAAIRRLNEMVDARGEDPGLRRYVTAATEGELDALAALVRDVRAAAAVERDDFSVEPRSLPLEELLGEAEGYASTLPGDHPVRTVLDGALSRSDRVLADPERVGQVLRNLLSNAAKYSAEGAPIELHAIHKNGRIRIEVADRGPGIRPEDLARIFEKFGRGRDQEGHKVPGVGLGLYLSRRISQAHGTELTVETEPGRGSVFAFELAAVPR